MVSQTPSRNFHTSLSSQCGIHNITASLESGSVKSTRQGISLLRIGLASNISRRLKAADAGTLFCHLVQISRKSSPSWCCHHDLKSSEKAVGGEARTRKRFPV